jgi:hypothetical protein
MFMLYSRVDIHCPCSEITTQNRLFARHPTLKGEKFDEPHRYGVPIDLFDVISIDTETESADNS